jgi:hypothetical protein
MRPSALALAITVALLAATAGHAQTADPEPAPGASDAPPEGATPAGTTRDDEADRPDAPLLRIDFPETEAIPGQFLTLRLTVLVPSFMPAPPVWPSLEAPNLLVGVPEGATTPVSERIDGATWSGVSRRYRISPMVPGRFEIPSQDVVVTWVDIRADDPARTVLSTMPLAFRGVLPDGSEGLDPFIAASDLTLTQDIEGDPGAMVPGDSLRRTITVAVDDLSPMFLPDILAPAAIPGLAAYPDEARIEETDNRGVLGGSRRESVTYVAESGGAGTLPGIEVRWFDLDTGTVETARAEAVEIAIDGPPAALSDPEGRRRIAVLAIAGVLLAAILGLALRLAVPSARRRLAERREARLGSEGHAWRALEKALGGDGTGIQRSPPSKPLF